MKIKRVMKVRPRRWLFFVAVVGIVFCLYYPVLHAPFLFDDYPSIVENTAIRSLDLPQIYNFKPLRFVGYFSFALNFYFSKLDTLSYHLVNIGIHLLYCFFCFLLINSLWHTPSGKAVLLSSTEKKNLAYAVAAVLALHPVNVFAVSYIVQRLASLTALLYVLTLLCYLKARLSPKSREKILYSAVFVFFLVCALFSKENAFTLFPMIFFIELMCFEWNLRRRLCFLAAIFFAVAVGAMAVYYNLIDPNEVQRLTIETTDMTRRQYLLTQFSVVCFYLMVFFVPINLALDYDRYILNSLTDPLVLIPGLILMCILVFTAWAATRKHFRLPAFGLVFYFIAISIESSIIPIRDTVFLHRTYLPNMGLAFAVLVFGYMLLGRWKISPTFLTGLFCLWVLLLAGVTFQTNHTLKSPVTAWERVLEVSPEYMRAYQVLGNYYVTMEGGGDGDMKKNYAKAREYIFAVHEHFPDHIKNLNNMGILYNREQQYEKAVACFERVLKLKPKYGEAYVNLGATYCNMQRYDLALDVLEKGYQIAPENYTLLVNYGQLLAILAPAPQSRYHKALNLLEKAAAIKKNDPLLFYAKGLAWYNLKDFKKAEQNFRKLLEIDPSFKEAEHFLNEIQKIISGK